MSMNKRRTQGFTLIEMLFFIVIVGVGLAGVLSVFQRSVAASGDPVMRKQAIAIAESMMEEIMLTEYANPTGGDVGSARATYDDVLQYNNYSSNGIVDKQGTAITGLQNYRVAVTVLPTTAAQQPQLAALTGFLPTAPAAPARRITVTVTSPDNQTVSLVSYRACYVNDGVQCGGTVP